MYGLEKKQKALFEFDLEKDLKQDPSKKQKLVKEVEEKIHEIKNIIRQGASTEDFNNYGVLLHGYAALQKVVNKISSK
ncbi:MAG: needle chaperone SctE [Chlamydiae bacterium]|nr:needle chaperone SctE [Chlamydiota bacterium]